MIDHVNDIKSTTFMVHPSTLNKVKHKATVIDVFTFDTQEICKVIYIYIYIYIRQIRLLNLFKVN